MANDADAAGLAEARFVPAGARGRLLHHRRQRHRRGAGDRRQDLPAAAAAWPPNWATSAPDCRRDRPDDDRRSGGQWLGHCRRGPAALAAAARQARRRPAGACRRADRAAHLQDGRPGGRRGQRAGPRSLPPRGADARLGGRPDDHALGAERGRARRRRAAGGRVVVLCAVAPGGRSLRLPPLADRFRIVPAALGEAVVVHGALAVAAAQSPSTSLMP